jgi:uncharacterized protein YqhQ
MAVKTSIGGQALIEGVMMRGPVRTALAVRDPEGSIVIEESDTKMPHRPALTRKPFIRGIFNLYDSLKTGYGCLMRSAEIAGLEDEEADKEKAEKQNRLFTMVLMPLAVILAVVLAVGLFIYLPTQLYKWLSLAVPALSGQRVVQSIFEGAFRIAIFVCYVAVISVMKDIRRTFQYHGAEHKTIFCYEAGLPLTVENVRMQRRFHPRCGTSFIILVLLVGIILGIFIPTNIPTILRTVIKILCLPLTAGIGYELIKLAGRSDNAATRIVSAPGMWLQHLTTKEPDDSMIECAIAAMEKVIPDDGSDIIK